MGENLMAKLRKKKLTPQRIGMLLILLVAAVAVAYFAFGKRLFRLDYNRHWGGCSCGSCQAAKQAAAAAEQEDH